MFWKTMSGEVVNLLAISHMVVVGSDYDSCVRFIFDSGNTMDVMHASKSTCKDFIKNLWQKIPLENRIVFP